jgi:hypothetical protein
MMDNKDFIMSLYVPGIWVAWLLLNVVLTLASPVIFVIALFSSHTPISLIIDLIELLSEALGLPVAEEEPQE